MEPVLPSDQVLELRLRLRFVLIGVASFLLGSFVFLMIYHLYIM